MTRVLLVGLDGATFDLLRPLAARGTLPNLARLLEAGASGVLRSTVPPVTPAAWTSIFTGKNPGVHGLFDFQRLDFSSYAQRTVRAGEHAELPLWDLLGAAGLRSIVWDVPFTYPPQPLPQDGWMLTGYGTPMLPGTVFTSPPDLADRVPPDLRPEIRLALPETRFDRSPAFIDSFREIMAGRRRLLDWLAREQPWDFFMVVFSITDTMAHVFWTFADPRHPNYTHPQAGTYREALFEAYALCDRQLGDLMQAAGPEAHTLVISDHGFGSVRPRQYLAGRLARGGYVRYAGSGKGGLRAAAARIAAEAYLRFPALRERVKALAPGRRKALAGGLRRAGVLPEIRALDLPRSKVIPTDFGLGLWVHDSDRFSQGPVNPAQREALTEQLAQFLLAGRDPVRGEPEIHRVHRGREVYHGPHAAQAPDLVIEYANSFDIDAAPTADNPHVEGGHTPEGIFIAAGPEIRPGALPEAGVADLAPTVLHLFGLPVPPDMDGRVLTEAFMPEALAQRPVRTGEQPARREPSPQPAYAEGEEEAVREQLRRLGYL